MRVPQASQTRVTLDRRLAYPVREGPREPEVEDKLPEGIPFVWIQGEAATEEQRRCLIVNLILIEDNVPRNTMTINPSPQQQFDSKRSGDTS